MEGVFQELIFIGNLGVVVFHGFGHHLVVLVFCVDHDEGGAVGLQLLDDFETIPDCAFILAPSDFVLQTFYGLLLLAVHIDVLVFSGFDAPILLGPFFFFGIESVPRSARKYVVSL